MQKPILLNFALPHTSDVPLLGNYDHSLSMWLAPSGIPLTEANVELPELRTKTDVIRERDDSSNLSILELRTKTKIDRESDD